MTDAAQIPQVPWVLQPGYEPVARRLLRTYFGTEGSDKPYTGAYFETLGGGDAPAHRDVITPLDIVAVSTLSVDVPAAASIALLGPDADRVSALLSGIPADVDLVDAEDALISEASPASQLWELLRGYKGVGRTKTSKLMARKRPRLVPIFDSVVERELGLNGSSGHWTGMREVLRADDGALHRRAVTLQDTPGVGPLISPLRVIDVVVWMHGTDHARSERWAHEEGLAAST